MSTTKKYIEFKCFEVTQPIGTFYIGAIAHTDLIQISYSDVRRIEKRDVEKYLGIERPLSPGRVAELQDYVNVIDATFPNNIILAISSEHAKYISSRTIMCIVNETDVAKIIDGQHRIAGLEKYSGSSFQMIVSIFIDMDIEDQAMVFSTINLKHTKVSKSLSYDLYEYAKARSPQKTCHNIAKLLNNKVGSPFKDRIKILGKATGKPAETLTQATFVDRLLKYITKKPLKDRDILKRGKKLDKVDENTSRRLIFRNMFIVRQDAEIARSLWNYFAAVEERWPKAWKQSIKGNILNRSTGFGALMRFLRPVYLSLRENDGIISKDDVLKILKEVSLEYMDFNPDRYKPGSSGESELFRDFCEMTSLND